jgi:hypothetical protein
MREQVTEITAQATAQVQDSLDGYHVTHSLEGIHRLQYLVALLLEKNEKMRQLLQSRGYQE